MVSGNASLLAVLKADPGNPVRSRFVAVGARVPAPIGIRMPAPPTPICSESRGADVAVDEPVSAEDSRTRVPGVGELLSRFLVPHASVLYVVGIER